MQVKKYIYIFCYTYTNKTKTKGCKMCNNNFNQSSSGINITYGVEVDYSSSQYIFDENFKFLKDELVIYTDWSNLSGEYSVEDDYIIEDTKYNRVILKKLLVDEKYYNFSELTNNFDELIELVFNINVDEDDLKDLFRYYNIKYTSNYTKLVSRGYNQGDYMEVLVNTKEFKKIIGVEFDKNLYQKIFDSKLWDAPLSVWVDINDIRFYSPLMDGLYCNDGGYNKEIFIKEILEEFKDKKLDLEVLKEELINTLPSEIN